MAVGTAVGAAVAGTAVGASVGASVGATTAVGTTGTAVGVAAVPQAESARENTVTSVNRRKVRRLFIFFSFTKYGIGVQVHPMTN
jgi:hypothetical protein